MYRHLYLVASLLILACRKNVGDDSDSSASNAPPTVDTRCVLVEGQGSRRCILWHPSLIELVARPEAYDGKRVRVIGFVNFEFEGNGLYVSREDWEQSILRNGVWIDPPPGFESDSAPSSRQPNQRYVIVEGTFHAGRGGHLGMWSGSLGSVTRLDAWGRDVMQKHRVLSRPIR